MKIVLSCVACKKLFYIKVDPEKYNLWKSGMLIQEAMPDMDSTTRECLISHLCPTCQDHIFNYYKEEIDD